MTENHNETEKKEALSPQSKYYFRLASHFRVLVIALTVILCVFVVLMYSAYREEITVENLRYFLRYIDTRQAEKAATTDVIVYDEIESIVRFGVYKNGLAVVGYDEVQLYDITGEAILDLDQTNAAPNLISGERYMLVYNIGGMTFQVFNSLKCVYEGAYTYGIGCAAMSDEGSFLVSTRSMEYRSVVNVYDKDFNLIYRWNTPDKLVMASDFRDDGEEFIIAALGTERDGSSFTEILVCERGTEDKKAQFRLADEMIIRVAYTNDGGYVLVGEKAIYYYNEDSECTNTVSFGGYTPTAVDTTGELTYFTVNKNLVGSNYALCVTDDKGKILYEGNVAGEITEALTMQDAVYLLLDRSVLRISYETGNQIERPIETNGITLLALDEDTLVCCYADQTRILDVGATFFDESQGEDAP